MNRTLIFVALLGCTGSNTAKDTSPTEVTSGSRTVMPQTMKPGGTQPSVNWVKGPALTTSESELVTWFEAQQRDGKPRMTRVPIVLARGKTGFDTRGVKIGSATVYVSDAALGIGIASRARSCTSDTCAFIAEGFWRGKEDGSY
ncbi:MAG TPA: hypothetical protein VK427_18595, partial [Kofleriaceae bacterium]|nr:hypothetical protein [Kofleriaceae bacterium]